MLYDIVYNYVTKCKNKLGREENATTYLHASAGRRVFFGPKVIVAFSESLIFPSVFCSNAIVFF